MEAVSAQGDVALKAVMQKKKASQEGEVAQQLVQAATEQTPQISAKPPPLAIA